MPFVSIIIPVYNEERTIVSLTKEICAWDKAKEIIIVDDGSTDQTPQLLKRLHRNITLISLKKNHGKSYAIIQGIRKSTGKYIMFLDADCMGVSSKALDVFLEPILSDNADMVVGIAGTHGLGDQKFYFPFHGQRIIRRQEILKYLDEEQPSGYGLEVYLNAKYKKKRIVYIRLPGVSQLKKYEKHGFINSLFPYIAEFFEVLRYYIKYARE